MKTRKDYLQHECTHREYYSQFVNQDIIKSVQAFFGEDKLMLAVLTDEHFNNIPLKLWDELTIIIEKDTKNLLRLAGDYYTLSGGVCILKEAAKQITENQQKYYQNRYNCNG